MNTQPVIRTLMAVLTASLLGLSACKKEADVLSPPPGSSTDEPGVATSVGKPIGAPGITTIGPGGGSLVTADGQLTLDIPAGALSGPTALTLQQVEKTLASGAGPAFTVLPNDTKLNKPVSVGWHYTTISGSAPELVGIAYQDEKGVWQGKMNTQADKVKKVITARMRNFSHPMTWYEQYYMTPQSDVILPNQRVDFTVYFQPGRTDASANPDDDIFVPLPVPVKEDEALRKLEQKELKNWQLNGELNLSDDRKSLVGSLDRLGQGGGASYRAPRAMIPKSDNPLAISVELKLKQRGVITMVSNLTMVDPENEFKIGAKTYKNANVEVITQSGGMSINMWENTDKTNSNRANLNAGIDAAIFKGNGTYVFEEKTKYVLAGAHDPTDSYGIQWVPEPNVLKYGPVSITITEAGGPGLPVAGRISATLHRYVEVGKRWEHIEVSAKFRVINNYFTGG